MEEPVITAAAFPLIEVAFPAGPITLAESNPLPERPKRPAKNSESQVLNFRCPNTLLGFVRERIASRNLAEARGHVPGAEGPWNLTDYLIHCIRADLAHAHRSRQRGKRNPEPF